MLDASGTCGPGDVAEGKPGRPKVVARVRGGEADKSGDWKESREAIVPGTKFGANGLSGTDGLAIAPNPGAL